MNRLLFACSTAALVWGLSACGEKPQTATPRKADAKAWQGADNRFTAPGWQAGDKASWDEQLRTRAQGQNEYNKVR
jgi:hypothetical protein